MSATSISNLQERLQDLQKAKETPSPAPQNAKIQRVPPHLLRNRKNFSKYYSPKLVSFGPIHHGDLNLHLGEQYKKMWAAEYIGSTKISPQELHKKVVQNMESLKPLFDDDLFTQNQRFSEYEKQGYGSPEDMISWMLFVDGCALLHILEHAKLDKPYKMNVKVDQLVLVMQDALLLENQLPFPLLEHLWRDSKVNLMEIMKGFLRCHHWATKEDQRHIGNGSDVSPENQDDMVTYRNIKELKAAGIEFMSSKTRRPADISFSLGWFHSTLKLPLLLC
ncbi:uncharacterized protein LOC108345139 isoform X2 [Vigna angularis]|uniref:uncharacterized protein LOC108345139 isoform X2 n=1 Tax=Phaseolus angularis TaxID=3914 RepID=UPI00080A5F6A|nr:uncharacterized protein LOC108345139 isoform X2 [Vigna angularis]